MPQWSYEFETDGAVTIFEDGQPITTGHGIGDEAMVDAWTTLIDTNRNDLAAWVAKVYKVRNGREPLRPKS